MKNYIVLSLLMLTGCKPDSSKTILSHDDSLKTGIRDSVAHARQDSLNKIEVEEQVYLERPWKLGTFNNEFGEPTKNKFIKASVLGSFSNSATSNEYLYVEILL